MIILAQEVDTSEFEVTATLFAVNASATVFTFRSCECVRAILFKSSNSANSCEFSHGHASGISCAEVNSTWKGTSWVGDIDAADEVLLSIDGVISVSTRASSRTWDFDLLRLLLELLPDVAITFVCMFGDWCDLVSLASCDFDCVCDCICDCVCDCVALGAS